MSCRKTSFQLNSRSEPVRTTTLRTLTDKHVRDDVNEAICLRFPTSQIIARLRQANALGAEHLDEVAKLRSQAADLLLAVQNLRL